VTLKVIFVVGSLSNSHTSGNKALLTTTCLHISGKAHVPCNFNCLIDTEG